jgi:hypothetical protein
LGYPVPGGNKYKNLALQVGGVSKIETICSLSPMGLKSDKGYTDDARQKMKSTEPTSRQRWRPTSINSKLPKKSRMGKFGHGSQMDA